jgi:hypothetical protein
VDEKVSTIAVNSIPLSATGVNVISSPVMLVDISRPVLESDWLSIAALRET